MKIEKKEELREQLVRSKANVDAVLASHRKKCGEAMEMIEAEPDKEKQVKLLNFLFEGGIDKVLEYYIRYTMLKLPKE